MNLDDYIIKPQLETLHSCILGPQGAGKSYLIGTLEVKTAHITTLEEEHGSAAVQAHALEKKMAPFVTTYGVDKNGPNCNEKFSTTLEMLDALVDSDFECVALDGLVEFEKIIKGTSKYMKLCRSNSGSHNSFLEGPAINQLFNELFAKLTILRRAGKHILTTCSLEVKDIDPMTGLITNSKPRLSTFNVASYLLHYFGDTLVVGPMNHPQTGKRERRIQFHAGVSRVGKNERGQTTKTQDFNPRINTKAGDDKLPGTMAADLKDVLAYKVKYS